MSAFGQKQTFGIANANVPFIPECGHKPEHSFSSSASSFDHLIVGLSEPSFMPLTQANVRYALTSPSITPKVLPSASA
jgi:hypothetical protein